MPYKALTYVNLPPDNRKTPGDTISDEELEAAGQTEENINQLLADGAMSADMDAEVRDEHKPVGAPAPSPESDENVSSGDTGQEG